MKVGDFGMACCIGGVERGPSEDDILQLVGTVQYAAPELINPDLRSSSGMCTVCVCVFAMRPRKALYYHSLYGCIRYSNFYHVSMQIYLHGQRSSMYGHLVSHFGKSLREGAPLRDWTRLASNHSGSILHTKPGYLLSESQTWVPQVA